MRFFLSSTRNSGLASSIDSDEPRKAALRPEREGEDIERARLRVAIQVDQQFRHEIRSIRENGESRSRSWHANNSVSRSSCRTR